MVGRMKTRMVLWVLAVSSAGACANEVDTSQNVLPWLSEREVVDAEEVAPEVATGSCDCLTVGRWYRMDSLALTTIDGKEHRAIPNLNNIWKADIAALDLSILMEVTAVDAASVTMRVVNGARIDGEQRVCRLDATAVDVVFPRDGCRLDASAESAFNVYAGTLDYAKNCSTTLPVKHAIPVSKARLEGNVSEDCGAILQGKVPSGGLGQAELGEICTCLLVPGKPASDCGALDPAFADNACVGCNAKYQPLGQLLNAFGAPDWLCTTESGAPAACLTADFTAVALEAGPEACPSP